MKTLVSLPLFALKLLAWALVFAAPLLGVWLASSLAAYLDGPIWMACAAGLLLFPTLPLAWDLWATSRWERSQERRVADGKERGERHLRFADRVILRTFFLNIGFVAVLLATFPQAGFTALATRGDWFLDTTDSPRAEVVRPVIFKGAERLEWLYELSQQENPYEEWADKKPLPTPKPSEFGKADVRGGEEPPPPPPPDDSGEVPPSDNGGEGPVEKPIPPVVVDKGETPQPPDVVPPRVPGEPPSWPLEPKLHPIVAQMPESVQTDYVSVARYIASKESDPFLRVKALHDYVADRLAYDVAALRSGDFPRQDAEAVFDRRMAVCAGYSRLLVAMAEETGDEILYVTGDARDDSGGISGVGHAWNVAKIEGKYYLIDATWNAGSVNGNTFKKQYGTSYLFTPPEIFGMNHLPDDPDWQLRAEPITRGDFVRQPMMQASFYAQGLLLESPTRSQVDAVDGVFHARLKNPRRRSLSARVDGGDRCSVSGARDVRIKCRIPPGTRRVILFAGEPGDQTLFSVGDFEVVSR